MPSAHADFVIVVYLFKISKKICVFKSILYSVSSSGHYFNQSV